MRFVRTYVPPFLSLLLAFFALSLEGPAFSEQTAPSTSSSPQALARLQKSLATLTGGQSITDITLSGAARRIAGSDDESGTATLKALATGSMRLDFSFPSGARSEVRANSTDGPSGDWSGPDGTSHSISTHNLFTDWGWFPAFTLLSVNSSANTLVTYVGQENRNGHSVYHLSVSKQFPQMSAKTAALTQHLSQMDIYLDASTSLPVSLVYKTHPDNDAGLDLPVEIDFSDYRVANGAQIPFHVQKYLNNSLYLDLQFQSIAVNTGLTAGAFTVQ